jgi:hypothetical protein
MTGTVATLDPSLAPANDAPAVPAPVQPAPTLCTWCGAEHHTPWGLTPCANCGHAPDYPEAA